MVNESRILGGSSFEDSEEVDYVEFNKSNPIKHGTFFLEARIMVTARNCTVAVRSVRSLNDIFRREKHFSNGYVLGDGVMVMVSFRTRAEVVERVLLPLLEPTPMSTGLAYVSEFHRTNFGATYNEAGLYLSAQYNGQVGKYCVSMPVTNDMALIWGREIYGYPKKIAETIQVKKEGNKVTGVCIRKGIPIIEVKVNLTAQEPKTIPQPTPNFLFKYFWDLDPRSGAFDASPCLIRQCNKIDWGKVEPGEGALAIENDSAE